MVIHDCWQARPHEKLQGFGNKCMLFTKFSLFQILSKYIHSNFGCMFCSIRQLTSLSDKSGNRAAIVEDVYIYIYIYNLAASVTDKFASF